MRYYVNIGGMNLYGVTDVSETAERAIDVYNGLGQGNFPVADSADLRSWEISCELTELDDRGGQDWRSAKKIFKQLESFRKSNNPKRLVVTSNYGKTSERVLLKSYSKAEKTSGVYDVKIKLTEYKSVSRRSTNIPYVPRPGKAPEPETQVFKNATEVAAAAIKKTSWTYDKPAGPQQFTGLKYHWFDKDEKLQETENPNLVPMNIPVKTEQADDGPKYNLVTAFKAISDALKPDDWR